MSKAIPGDGKIREKIGAATRQLDEAIKAVEDSFNGSDEGTVRNNLDTASSAAAIDVFKRATAIAEKFLPIAEKAHEHHSRQTSVLPNDYFGRRRRIRDGKPVVIDRIDPAKFAEQCNKDSFHTMTAEQQERYVKAGMNPPPEWAGMTLDQQRDYALGVTTN